MGKESIGEGLSEEVVVGVLKQMVHFEWLSTHSAIIRDMKVRFEDKDVKDEIKEIKKEMVNFYNKHCNDPSTPNISKNVPKITILTCSIIIEDREPPDKRPEESLEEICSDLVTRRAKDRAGAIIADKSHINIASGVIIDD